MTNDLNLDELADELAEFAAPEKNVGRSPREERIVAGFEEIQRFFDQHGRAPEHGEDKDIFERLYAVRLARLRAAQECRAILLSKDRQGLLNEVDADQRESVESMDDDELLAELEGVISPTDITELRHVRAFAEKKAAEEIEHREVCEDFERFKPLFDSVQQDLKSGIRQARTFQTHAKAMDAVQQNAFFILNGQVAHIAELGEEFTTQYDRRDSRLRVVFDNGTESKILLRSFQRALHRDETARVISDSDAGPLFDNTWEHDDIDSGTVYVLRSLSGHPFVAEHRELIHKIGVTGGKVETRIADAAREATYLLADVEVVASYKLASINRTKLEGVIHRIFAPAQIDLTIHDRFGHPVKPREWFLVPLHVIDEAVNRISDGSITNMLYDPATARLVNQSN
jgi:hypothetical protein